MRTPYIYKKKAIVPYLLVLILILKLILHILLIPLFICIGITETVRFIYSFMLGSYVEYIDDKMYYVDNNMLENLSEEEAKYEERMRLLNE